MSKITFNQCIEKYIKENYIGTDNTCNGKCTKCGECCGIVLPLDREDENRIKEYVIENRIFPQKHMRIMTNKWQCPYYNGNREKGCSIYKARPKICRYYQCNKTFASIEEIEMMKKAIPVDMWAFAEAVEKEMKNYGINQENGKTIKQSI